MKRVHTIQARAVEKIASFAAGFGVNAESLYAAVALDPRTLDDPDRRIPFAQLVRLYEEAATLTGDKAFGLHLGASIEPNVFDVLGYAAMNSPTFGEALTRVVRYHSIWTDGAAIEVNNSNGVAKIAYLYLDETLGDSRQDSEMTLATMVSLGRVVTQSEWSPVEVRFKHPAPNDTSEHARVFRAPLRFAAEKNELVCDPAILALPIVKADSGLRTVLERHAEELLVKYPRPDLLVESVRSLIRKELNGGNPSLERVSNQLGLSARTLQRRLREHGTSYHGLLDQMRRDLAVRYVKQPDLAICELAYLLGFSESSALHRAFKRWTGTTPTAFRDS